MECPKCGDQMDTVDYKGIEVDRCRLCGGLWFDSGELTPLRGRAAAAKIDTGDRARGERANAIDRYRCPRCRAGMVRMVDARQPHIWYEKCGMCHGTYFDAGEFTDLSSHTLLDLYKRLSAPERR